MNLIRTSAGLAASLLLLANTGIVAEDRPPTLSANPFEWPAWFNEVRETPRGERTAGPGSRIDLRATLTAGEESLVNVAGQIIGIGDEVGGYRLVAVAEGEAVFSNDDEIIHVSVVSDAGVEDNESE